MPRYRLAAFALVLAGPLSAQEPTVSFAFENKKWADVIDWFRIESGLVYAGTLTPTGTVTIRPGPGKKYTIPQVIDLLNELLEPKYVILRREQTFTILPADEPIDASRIPRVTEATELAKLGRTEVVQYLVPLGPLAAEDVVPSLRFLLTSFGRIIPLGNSSLIVQDKAATVQRIAEAVTKLGGDLDQDRFSHPCRYVRSTTAAETLKALFGVDAVQVDLGLPYTNPYAGPGGQRPANRAKAVRVTVQESSNTILVTGPADKIAFAKKFLKEDIDTGAPGTELRPGGDMTFRDYPVAPGTAATVSATVQAAFKNSSVVVVPIGNDRISVYGYPMDHAVIAKQVLAGDPNGRGEPVTEIVPLLTTDPRTIAALLTRMFPATHGLPMIEPQFDGLNTGVLVRATADQLKKVRREIEAIDNPDGGGVLPSNRRMIALGGSSGILAECLADFVRLAGKNDVIILDPVAPPEKKTKPREIRKRTPPPQPVEVYYPPMPQPGDNFVPMQPPRIPD